MSDSEGYRCFIGGLSWTTTERTLKAEFEKFGTLVDIRVVADKYSGRSKGFGFVTFKEIEAMEEAIKLMNGENLDGRTITVDRAQPQGSGRDRDGGRYDDYRGGRDRDYSSGGRGSGGNCYKCGRPGHFARECPSDDSDNYGRDRYNGGRSSSSRYGSDRGGDRYESRSRDGNSRGGGNRYGRDRSGPYERPHGSRS